MKRLLASLWLAGTFLLSSCSSEPDVLYEVVDGLVVIDSESWSTKQDSPLNRWQAVSSDAGQVAKLGPLLQSELQAPVADHQTSASAIYEIDFNEPGLFYLWMRARTLTETTKPTLSVEIAPGTNNTTQQLADFSDQWQWIPLDVNQNILSVNIASPELHRLSITTDATGLLVDKIVLTTKPDFIPTGAGPEATLKAVVEDTVPEDADQSEVLIVDGNDGNPIDPVIDANTEQQNDGINEQPKVQIQHAGIAVTDIVLTQGQQLQLFADATDDGLPTQTLHTYWTKISGPGDVEFSDQTDAAPAVSFSAAGIYALQVSANDTELYKNAIVTVTVEASNLTNDESTGTDTSIPDDTEEEASGNQPPSVSISGPTTAIAGEKIELTAVTDNGQSDNPIYHYWNKAHGNGSVTITSVQSQSTAVSFDQAGHYVLQVSASNNTSYANATIEINVTAALNDQPDSTIDQSVGDSDNNNQANLSQLNIGSAQRWQNAFANGSPQQRHETSGVAVNGKMYIIGGRGHQPIDVYDSVSNTWSQAAKPPLEMHHFQAVAIAHTIYVVGASTCCFPQETNIANVYEFDTQTGKWSKGVAIPANRLRGSTAAAVYNNKIYIVGGNTRGHSGGAVNWFDEFDPATGHWKQLADAPDARDHATIAIVGDQLVVAGGRRSAQPDTFGNTVGRTNIYDLKQQRWQIAANIPTQRAGTMAVGIGSELVVIGGESKASRDAHNAVEAFNIFTGNWRKLQSLPTPRHGGAAAVINNDIHVVAGSKQMGGGPETNAHEILKK